MPTVNIFYKIDDAGRRLTLGSLTNNLKNFLAQALTCKDMKLKPAEISVRLIGTDDDGMIGKIEVEITAQSFEERVKNQDTICLDVVHYLHQKTNMPINDIKAWLLLVELGHSWQKNEK